MKHSIEVRKERGVWLVYLVDGDGVRVVGAVRLATGETQAAASYSAMQALAKLLAEFPEIPSAQ